MKLVLTLTLVTTAVQGLSGCAHSKPAAQRGTTPTHSSPVGATDAAALRTPAGSDSEDRLETTFNMLLEASDPAQRFRDYFARVISIYLYSDALVREFDGYLDETVRTGSTPSQSPLLDSAVYKKVRALWALTIREHEKIEFIYGRLLDTEKNSDTLKRESARRARVELENYLYRRSGVERLALHDILTTVNEIRAARGLRTRRIADPKSHLVELGRLRGDLKKKSLFERETNESLRTEVEVLVTQAEAREPGRTPQSEGMKFYPDTGKAGNIVGGNFPPNTWALTYDDGPSARFTPVILKNLTDNSMKATFFWLAQNASQSWAAPIIKDALAKGMEPASHSWSHANLPKLGQAGLNREIFESTDRLTSVFGGPFRFFRCPYGAGVNSTKIRQMLVDRKLIHVFWNVDSLDWQDKNPQSVLARVKKQMAVEKQGVVLFHDIHSQSAEASRMLMEWSKTQPIRWVTMSEVVDELNGQAPARVPAQNK